MIDEQRARIAVLEATDASNAKLAADEKARLEANQTKLEAELATEREKATELQQQLLDAAQRSPAELKRAVTARKANAGSAAPVDSAPQEEELEAARLKLAKLEEALAQAKEQLEQSHGDNDALDDHIALLERELEALKEESEHVKARSSADKEFNETFRKAINQYLSRLPERQLPNDYGPDDLNRLREWFRANAMWSGGFK